MTSNKSYTPASELVGIEAEAFSAYETRFYSGEIPVGEETFAYWAVDGKLLEVDVNEETLLCDYRDRPENYVGFPALRQEDIYEVRVRFPEVSNG